ncbi:MAG TPA: glycosyltransferase [Gemmatimonadaceae bacterium]|nr:glycosyltransferase [Gemmatimonadaceae bacterium]
MAELPLGSPEPVTTFPLANDVVLIPVFNDWESLALLIPQLDKSLSSASRTAELILVDDCSVVRPAELAIAEPLTAIRSIDVVTLARNLGDQRAIAIGLSYIAMRRPCRAVVVMDGDGEDMPSDVPRLLDAFDQTEGKRVVFAKRTRRPDDALFALFYRLYRMVHWLLTGIRVEVGNFSVVPYAVVRKLAVVSEMWNHYAAAVTHARVSTTLVPTVPGKRLAGPPAVSFVSVVAHGLSAMSVLAETIGVRLLATTGILMGLLYIALVVVGSMRYLTDLAIPAWTTVALGVLAVLLIQTAILSMVFMFMILIGRASVSFVPAREYELFVDSVKRVWEKRALARVL